MRRSPLALLPLVPLLASAPAADEVAFRVEKGAVIEKTFDHQTSLELEEMKLRFGDEEVSPDDVGDFDMSIESKSQIVFVDEYREMGPGRPKVLARKFKTLDGSETQHSSSDGESDDQESEEESELEGKTVLFTWSDDDEAFARTYEGEAAGEALLEPLVEDVDLREFLPGKSVATDDRWDVDAKCFDRLLSPGGDLAMVSEEDDEDSADLEHQLSANLTGDVRVTYKGTRDEGGAQVAVLAIEADVKSFGEQEKDEDGEKSSRRYEFTSEVEGELLWDAKNGRPHSYSLEGKSVVRFVESTSFEHEGESFEMSQTIVLAGPNKLAGAWSLVE